MRLSNYLSLNHFFLLLLVVILQGNIAAAEPAVTPNDYKLNQFAEPKPAPDFKLRDMDGKPHSLKDYQGKVVLINFWATWCPPCVREMPSLESLYQKLHDQPFVVLAINQWEDEEKVFEFSGKLKTNPTFPILFDPESKVSAAYNVQGLPTSFIIDRKGRIVYRAKGGRDYGHAEIERKIRSLF